MEDVSETPEIDAVVVPAPDVVRVTGNATGRGRGLAPPKEVVRVCEGGSTKRSGRDVDGGERGRDVRIGTLPGELVSESRCWARRNVGVNSGPSSCDRNLDESSDSRSNILKSGVSRYMVDTESVPRG